MLWENTKVSSSSFPFPSHPINQSINPSGKTQKNKNDKKLIPKSGRAHLLEVDEVEVVVVVVVVYVGVVVFLWVVGRTTDIYGVKGIPRKPYPRKTYPQKTLLPTKP